jgi:hypothetical protein
VSACVRSGGNGSAPRAGHRRALARRGADWWEMVADIDLEAAEIIPMVHWVGGIHSEMRLPGRRRGQRNSTSADVIAAVRQG